MVESKLKLLAEKLLEKEVIFKEDLISIFGPRKWEKPDEKESIKKKEENKKTEESAKKTSVTKNKTNDETPSKMEKTSKKSEKKS